MAASRVPLSLTSLLFQGSPRQKGIVTYSLSSNRQRPLAGILNAAVFNTWRRFRGQVLYFAPPLVLAYLVMDWATQKSVLSIEFASSEHKLSYSPYRNEYLNSKPGRLANADKEE